MFTLGKRSILGIWLLLLASTVRLVSAQSTPPEAPSHRFFDRQNVMAFGALAGLCAVDAVNTQQGLSSKRFVEADPLARPLVTHGWSGQLAASALGYGAALSLTYTLHRTHHHKVERWTAWLLVGAEAANDTRNLLLKSPPPPPAISR